MRILLPCILFSFLSVGQTTDLHTNSWQRPTKSLYIDLFGGGSWFSGNFDKIFLSRENSFLSFRAGLGYMEERGEDIPGSGDGFIESFNLFSFKNGVKKNHHLTVPMHFTYNVGNGVTYFEFGAHFSYFPRKTWDPTNVTLGPVMGVRVTPKKMSGMTYRAYINMPYEGFKTYDWYVPFGISIGYSAE